MTDRNANRIKRRHLVINRALSLAQRANFHPCSVYAQMTPHNAKNRIEVKAAVNLYPDSPVRIIWKDSLGNSQWIEFPVDPDYTIHLHADNPRFEMLRDELISYIIHVRNTHA